MAKRRKKNRSESIGGFVFGIILICILAVTAVAIAKNANNSPDGDTVAQETQSDTMLTATDTDGTLTSEKTDSNTNAPTSEIKTDTTTKTDPISEKESTESTSKKTENKTSDTKHDYVSTNDTASFDKDQWYMLLANPDHAVPENYTFEQAKVYSAGRNWIVDARCAEDLKAMIAAAKADGVDLIICSAYRTIEKQTTNFNNKMKEYLNKGYSEEEARKVTATIIAVPGTSEHHTGMAADIVTPSYQSLNAGFDKTSAYKWLEAHCAEFGFVLRYRKDKTEITKIIYEPWHYRYVGKEAATIMMEEKISLEEFLEKYGV